jgi:PHD/YefM family antitoxin component YafN of YafNO toxin-antitoxin module
MRLTASSLRANVYRILDRVLETGVPVLIERKGKMLKIVAVEAASKLDNLKPRPYLAADPEELVSLDWSGEWEAESALDPSDEEGE